MNIRLVGKLLLPPVCLLIYRRLRYGKPKLQQSALPQIERHTGRMVIIGNGPSLNESVEKYKVQIVDSDRIAVNFFASSELYEVLKPNIYVFADPAFFNIPENQKSSIGALFKNLIEKTTWPMRMVVPISARNAVSLNSILANKYISLDFYYNGQQDVGNMTKFEAWDNNLIGPPAQNVLNVALYLSLYWGYEETYLIGADSSFLEDLRVDQETNELFSIDTHFYKRQQVYCDKKLIDAKRGRVMSDWTLHGLIYAYGKMFDGYYELKQYADYKGLKVYNASEYSWINVFERKKLK